MFKPETSMPKGSLMLSVSDGTSRKNGDLVRLGEMSGKQRRAALTAAERVEVEVVQGDSHGNDEIAQWYQQRESPAPADVRNVEADALLHA